MFTIRYATPTDLPPMMGILKQYNMHHIPSEEMPHLDLSLCYVAQVGEQVVGLAGFRLLSPELGKTTLLAVDKSQTRSGIGYALQRKRLLALKSLGCLRVVTHADHPETISWYQRHFGYQIMGETPKHHTFGLADLPNWTRLEADLSNLRPDPPDCPTLIINAALTGAVHSPRENPHLPITPEQIARDALKVFNEGAHIVHIHARDESGQPTSDPEIYREIILRIRDLAPQLIICASTTGRWVTDPSQRGAVLELEGDARPDMASLTLGSMNFPKQASVNPPETITYLAQRMLENGIKPETEVFDLGMLDYARYLVRKGLLRLPLYTNVLLGNLGTLAAREENVMAIREALPIDTCWALTGIGRYQASMVDWAVKNGSHARIGLEDNLFEDPETRRLTSNQQLVACLVEKAQRANRPLAGPEETRRLLGFPQM